jgi:O-antigen/teichoic acid export membrane protein
MRFWDLSKDCHTRLKLSENKISTQKKCKNKGMKLFKNSIVYAFSSILSAAVPFLLLPILTRYLSPEQYGQIAMFTVTLAALASVIGFSAHGAANRRFFDEGATHTHLARFNANCLIILLVSTSLVLCVLLFTSVFFASYIGIPVVWIYLGVLCAFCTFILNLRLGQWQIRGKAKVYGVLQVTNSSIALLFSLLFVVFLHLGPDGRVYGIVVTSLLVGLASFYTLISDKLFLFEYNKQDIREALSYGLPLIPHVLGAFLLLSVDRLVINKELGLEMTGIYMVAFSLGSALNIIFSSINNAFSPWLFGQLKENDEERKRNIVKRTYVYFVFLILMSLLAFFVAPSILKLIVGEKFHQAAEILPILIIGQVFVGMYFMVTNYIFYVKKTKYLSYVTISSGAINVTLLLVLIPYYGIEGAAFSFLIASFWQFICTWIVSAKLYPMPWFIFNVRSYKKEI